MITELLRLTRISPLLIVALLASAFMPGCSAMAKPKKAPAEEERLIIPDYPTPKDQYNFARVYQASQIKANDPKRLSSQYEKAIQAYKKVLELFPNDEQFTPLAMLNWGDCVGMQGDMAGGRAIYKDAAERWPNIDLIQARANYSTARTLDQEKRFEEAKVIYKLLMDHFGNSQDPALRQIAKLSSEYYYKLRTEPVKETKGRRK
jgi:tetratricopeptide (TPR) repeat protein